jgi:hypothetical protein
MLLLYSERLANDSVAQTLAWIPLRGIPLRDLDTQPEQLAADGFDTPQQNLMCHRLNQRDGLLGDLG